jgi:integrase
VEKSKSQNPRIIQDRLRAGCCASGIDPHTGTKAIVDQIHATLSSMFTQAFRWGWRDTNPAQWAEPPPAENEVPVVPTPEEVMRLIDEANESRRPDKARAMFVVATTGLRRADICALKRDRDVDWERGIITVTRSIVALPREAPREIPTKNRRARPVALGDLTLGMLRRQLTMLEERARALPVRSPWRTRTARSM